MIHCEPKFSFTSSKIYPQTWVKIKQVNTAFHLAHHHQLQTEYKWTQLYTKYKFLVIVLWWKFCMVHI